VKSAQAGDPGACPTRKVAARADAKGGRPRVVRIGHEAARALDRYLRARSRHRQAWRPQLWLGVNNRGPMTANGIYQMIARRGRLPCSVSAVSMMQFEPGSILGTIASTFGRLNKHLAQRAGPAYLVDRFGR
jgi:hypothetical protein